MASEREAGAVVLDLNSSSRIFQVHTLAGDDLAALDWRLKVNADLGIGRIGLQGVEEDFGERMLQRGPVTGDDDGLAAVLALEPGGLDPGWYFCAS